MSGEEHVPPEDWLHKAIRDFDENYDNTLQIPKREGGREYSAFDLYDDQKEIVTVVMEKLHEWLYTENYADFKPLRMVLNGAGGSGKSVVINTIVTMMRQMFNSNDVVKVVAPTGTAAFNVGGETLHHLLKERVTKTDYTPFGMSIENRKNLVKKFSSLIALICDERSLLTSRLLGTTEQKISETLYNGFLNELSWGGLPIVILVGDDYQLPGIGEGSLDALYSTSPSKMTQKGRDAFLETARFVMELKSNKRLDSTKTRQKELMDRIRIAEDIRESDIEKIMSLSLENIKDEHGPNIVSEIEKEAIYLFYKNDKRIRKNLERVAMACSPDNPVAICRSMSYGTKTGKGINSHFDNKDTPSAALICRGCKVALDGRNYNPLWGLHNGACGTVIEIVFSEHKSSEDGVTALKDTNPNYGHLPDYVVVDFPQYCGPPWDPDNPTVSEISLDKNFRVGKYHLMVIIYVF